MRKQKEALKAGNLANSQIEQERYKKVPILNDTASMLKINGARTNKVNRIITGSQAPFGAQKKSVKSNMDLIQELQNHATFYNRNYSMGSH
jgi:hypothetical protein